MTTGRGGFLRVSRFLAVMVVAAAIHGVFFTSDADAAVPYLYANDRQAADAVFGNLATLGQGQLGSGTVPPSAHNFNNPIAIGMGARAIGMGEAFTALADELSAVWYNPAGLAQMDKSEVQIMAGDRYSDLPYCGFASASYMLQNRMVFALSLLRPWHPTGAYPDVLVGAFDGFSKFNGGGKTMNIVSNSGATGKIPFSDISDTSVQAFLRSAYRAYINPPFQENALTFTYSTPLSPDENLSMGINVKYLYTDSLYAADGMALDDVGGWGLDLGFQYRQPLKNYGRELAFGLNLRDVAGQVRFNGGSSSAREVTLAPVSTIGVAWRTMDFFTRSDLNLDADFIYINDPALDDNANRRLYLGGEMWFLNGKIGPRMGYRMFFNRQLSGPSVGISFRYLVELDYAYLFAAENEEATHWFTLGYRWGGLHRDIPLPDVSCTVDPPIFAPRNGETATFALSADAKNGIDRWTLSIIDRSNNVVKSYQDRGTPPPQIIWGGEDKVYRLLPDGEYTYLFTATDHAGASQSTPVQTLKIFTPPKPVAEEDRLDALRKLIKKEQVDEIAQDAKETAAVTTGLQKVIKDQQANTTLPDVAKTPEVLKPVTPSAEVVPPFSYPRVNDVPASKSQVTTGADGKKVFSVSFATMQDNPKSILMDVTGVIREAAGSIGDAVARYDVTARYGTRELRVVAPASAALSLSRGFITPEKLLGAASVTLDGDPISPNYQ